MLTGCIYDRDRHQAFDDEAKGRSVSCILCAPDNSRSYLGDRALLVAERSVVGQSSNKNFNLALSYIPPRLVFHDQPISIEEQLELGRHFGPLHKHATTGMPTQPGLEEVHGAGPASVC